MPDSVATIDWTAEIRQLLRPTPGSPGGQTTLDAQGAVLEAIGTGVQAYIESITSRRLGSFSNTEAYDGDDTDTLFLRHDPILTVSSVSIDGAASLAIDDGTSGVAPTYPLATVC